ncbi:MAG: class I SAM-dependent methyltransferase [Aquabacterium sp.]
MPIEPKTCRACHGADLTRTWTGHCRSGHLGEFSAEVSDAWQCRACHSIFIHSGRPYAESNFQEGVYRQSVDGQAGDQRGAYFLRHKDSTLGYLQHIAPSLIWQKDVLDFGCGAGLLIDMIARQARRVVGIDLDENFHRSEDNLDIVRGVDEARRILPQVDTALCFSTIGHLHDVEGILDGLATLVKPGGHLIIGCVNPEDILIKAAPVAYAKVFYRQNYPNCFSASGLRAMMARRGFRHEETKFEQRHGWANFLGHIGISASEPLKAQPLSDELYKALVESQGLSDYMYITFQRDGAAPS